MVLAVFFPPILLDYVQYILHPLLKACIFKPPLPLFFSVTNDPSSVPDPSLVKLS